ncbi:DUF4179 domain-containing protein [Paenibacillus jilunlii]|uniref:DUF4179 domain-containing protein n=1 Tax=Paenibacillus jilunlii TaxID=682956 RepID=A0A1G9J0N7_9BACL|nr:DUF4179 domain-containing protein [Paenibacillus jilunlii]KWX78495.1 hypothetical protein AML91_05190 [Paenibacillus jilunlii]SDL30836.1 protein of unknown function [Paenibacillus jilunlii]
MNNENLEKQLRELRKANKQELPPLLRTRQDSIYASLATIVQDSAGKKKKRKIYPKIAAIAAAILLSVMLTAIYPPALANALKQLPWVGGIFERADDLGLQAAQSLGLISRPNSSDTHEGITLSAEEAVFDGNRLAFSVKREGEGLGGKLTGVTVGPDGKLFQEKGTISSAKVMIDGVPLEVFADGRWDALPSLSWIGGKEGNTAIFALVDSSNLGISTKPFPDQFVLTLTIGLEGIDEPFILQIPARRVTENIIDNPDIRVQADGWSLTLQKLEYSPLTTRLSLTLEQEADGDRTAFNLTGFEVKDEQGLVLENISQSELLSSDRSRNVDLLTEPFGKHPNMLTIRAYYNELKGPEKKHGLFKTDSTGNPVKHYIDGLEIKVAVQ